MYLKDRVALNPPLGWNSWDCYGPAVNEEQLLANAGYMNDHLKAHGYQYIVCDIQWYEPDAGASDYNPFAKLCMDENGRLVPAVNRFPSAANGKGFKPIADKIHAMGLKFGIHIMRGIPRQAVYQKVPIKGTNKTAKDIAENNICPWNSDMYGVNVDMPEGQKYYNSLIELYASWGVDFIKCDDIAFSKYTNDAHEKEIRALRKAIDKVGHPIVLSLSPGPTPIKDASFLIQNANMWRITDDFWDDWEYLKEMFWRCERWQSHVKPGQYPDCDMLPLGRICINQDGKGRNTRLTKPEQITLMTLWCIFRSPLIMGGEMRDNDAFTLSLLTNDNVLYLNQHGGEPLQLFRDEEKAGWINYVDGIPYIALFNLQNRTANVSFPVDEILDSKPYAVEEIWTNSNSALNSNMLSASLEPHGAALFRLLPIHGQ